VIVWSRVHARLIDRKEQQRATAAQIGPPGR
jgi:hypothetical protein